MSINSCIRGHCCDSCSRDHMITHLIILVVEDVSHMTIHFIILVGVKVSHKVDPQISVSVITKIASPYQRYYPFFSSSYFVLTSKWTSISHCEFSAMHMQV